MKLKTIMFVLFIGLFINPVLCETEYSENFIFSETEQISQTSDLDAGSLVQTLYTGVTFKNPENTLPGGVKWVTCSINKNNVAELDGEETSSQWNSVNLKVGSTLVGTGQFGYIYANDIYHIGLFLDDNFDISGYTGRTHVIIEDVVDFRFTPTSISGRTMLINSDLQDDNTAIFGVSGAYGMGLVITSIHTVTTTYYQEFDYIYGLSDYNTLYFNLNHTSGHNAKLKITNDYETIIDDNDYETSHDIIHSTDLDNSTWCINISNNLDDIYLNTIELLPEIADTTLTTDKTYYNTSEIIEISFTNIDTIYNECGQSICAKPYDLHILYPVSDAYKDYESKYIYPLTYNLEDEIIYLNTSFLSPENNYILGIVGINGNYHKHEDILIFSDSFTVYSDNEYLSVSCDSETSCYTYNNADITIYYQINNNSNIIIKDNDNNVINTYYNIIGNGSILYHIPDDLYHINTYPNWKVYLNNTEYSTSFNKGITVYWSQFQTPTPTPTFTPKPTPDINISDEIDNLKDEISPIKNLIFGLSEIIIDNPDYNKDNIVDENEINHWFNSLIPICIILLLLILYIGLKKNRND